MASVAAFLDRDGVINVDHGYVSRWADFEFAPGAVEALRRLQAAGVLLVVVSNQSGIARGFCNEADVDTLHAHLQAHLKALGVALSHIAYCPHLPDAPVAVYARVCDCRKPAPGLLLAAREALDIDLSASVMFGDKSSDMEAAHRAGVAHAVLIRPSLGHSPAGGTPQRSFAPASACVPDLSAGVDWWLTPRSSDVYSAGS